MNLKEHKELLFSYEEALRELKLLKEAQNLRGVDWKIISSGDFEIPVPRDYAEAALQNRIWELESKIEAQALALGINHA